MKRAFKRCTMWGVQIFPQNGQPFENLGSVNLSWYQDHFVADRDSSWSIKSSRTRSRSGFHATFGLCESSCIILTLFNQSNVPCTTLFWEQACVCARSLLYRPPVPAMWTRCRDVTACRSWLTTRGDHVRGAQWARVGSDVDFCQRWPRIAAQLVCVSFGLMTVSTLSSLLRFRKEEQWVMLTDKTSKFEVLRRGYYVDSSCFSFKICQPRGKWLWGTNVERSATRPTFVNRNRLPLMAQLKLLDNQNLSTVLIL